MVPAIWGGVLFSARYTQYGHLVVSTGADGTRPELAMVLVSGFGEQAEVTGTRFFCYAPIFL